MKKKIKLITSIFAFVALMTVNIQFGFGEDLVSIFPNFQIENIQARSGNWAAVGCGGPGPDYCVGDGNYTCCKTFTDTE